MAISSLGVGSSILTQDVLDQLRKADEAARITPVDLNISLEKDRKTAFSVMDAHVTNLTDSINAIKDATVWNARTATVLSGTSVEVSASENTDVQDFSIHVNALATKQIEQSGSFTAETDVVDAAAGSFDIQVGAGAPVTINYSAGATLDDIKDLINEQAVGLVDATIVQVATGDYRLFLSSEETGSTKDISITGGTIDTRLTTGLTAVQTGTDASFDFNGQAITRESNEITDLITGLTLTLKEVDTGTNVSEVSIAQDRTSILEKFDNFVKHYNETIGELAKLTKASTDSEERGIYSSDSTIKSMKRAIEDMIINVGGGVASMIDYGFEIDKDGKLSLDKTTLETKLDDELVNTQAFFSGGDYTKTDLTVVTLEGAFSELFTIMDSYSGYNEGLDQFKDSITERLSDLEDKRQREIEKLDAKYEIMAKQFAAYDLVISKINSASSMFVQIANAQTAAQNS